MKKSALLTVLLAIASLSLVSCSSKASTTGPPSGLTERVFASQSASSATASGALVIINGANDTVGRGAIRAGSSPGLMVTTPQRAALLAFDSSRNQIDVVNTLKETLTGSVQLPGATTSIVAPQEGVAYAAVPAATINGSPAGGLIEINLASGATSGTISVPGAQTVVSNSDGSQLLVFSSDSDSVTVVSPSLLNSSAPVTLTVPGFDRPVNAVFNGSIAYILNCGAECLGIQASIQTLDLSATPPTAGTPVPVDGATIGMMSGSSLYVIGNSTTNNACTGETTTATTCGRLDIIDTGSMTVTGSAVITDGYHNRIDMSSNGQLFMGSMGCTTIGNVNAPQGEVRGCLSIYNTASGSVIVPADNGDVTGLQSFSSRDVEYVAEGGRLRVYDTLTNSLLLNSFISDGTIIITGVITDVKAVDFF